MRCNTRATEPNQSAERGKHPHSMTGVDDPDGDVYDGDEWEGEPSVQKPEIELEQVHPLHAAVNVTAKLLGLIAAGEGGSEGGADGYSEDDFDAEKSPTMSTPRKNTGSSIEKQPPVAPAKGEDEISKASLTNTPSESDDKSYQIDATSADERECTPSPNPTITKSHELLDLVSIHGHRGEVTANTVLPPPAPSTTPSRSGPVIDRQLERLRIAEKSARIAAKRIAEFRETQTQKEAQFAADTTAQKKARQKFRASNQKVYQQMGVSHLTGEQRYQLLIEEKKLKKAHDHAKLKSEKQQRWHNVKRLADSNKTAATPAHMEKLKQLEQQNRERWH
ncbi:hypothetical protein FI667_g8549, partial [Globisporangium splendens]